MSTLCTPSYKPSRCRCRESDTIIPRVISTDEGVLSGPDVPLLAISLSGTGLVNTDYQYHTIGPLICYQGLKASITNRAYVCKVCTYVLSPTLSAKQQDGHVLGGQHEIWIIGLLGFNASATARVISRRGNIKYTSHENLLKSPVSRR